MFNEETLTGLRGIGLAPAMARQAELRLLGHGGNGDDGAPLAAAAHPALMRVAEVQREGLTLHDGRHEHAARMLPALRAALAAEADALAVGDWVFATRNAFGEWWVHERLPPLSQLARRLHDGRDKVERVVIDVRSPLRKPRAREDGPAPCFQLLIYPVTDVARDILDRRLKLPAQPGQSNS